MLKPYLLTLLINPITRAEQLYNESQIRTRNCVERRIGVWKRQFPSIASGLRCKWQTSLSIIVATAVLHNIAIQMNEPEPPAADNIDLAELNYLIDQGDIPDKGNRFIDNSYRQILIDNNFSHLINE